MEFENNQVQLEGQRSNTGCRRPWSAPSPAPAPDRGMRVTLTILTERDSAAWEHSITLRCTPV
jgi:hypothetical protein